MTNKFNSISQLATDDAIHSEAGKMYLELNEIWAKINSFESKGLLVEPNDLLQLKMSKDIISNLQSKVLDLMAVTLDVDRMDTGK
ncbi:hypothetical protein [Bdellovibrio sp. BCCA]|uniref:hypothetical protein n=1 Tax=Bdellovibrio sp. BCCA TaxID=3136281 RepID=UPI0030F0F5FD